MLRGGTLGGGGGASDWPLMVMVVDSSPSMEMVVVCSGDVTVPLWSSDVTEVPPLMLIRLCVTVGVLTGPHQTVGLGTCGKLKAYPASMVRHFTTQGFNCLLLTQ